MGKVGRAAGRGVAGWKGCAGASAILRTRRRVIVSATAIASTAAVLSAAGAGTAGAGGNSPTCFGKRATIVGTPHGEVIRGTSGRDVIVSFGGRDGILAKEGNDFVCSGSGNDTIHGAEGFNRMNGGGGHDWIDGRRGPGNIVIAGTGPDHVEAEGKLDGGAGDDIIESYGYQDPSLSPVADVAKGGTGDDDIYGCGGTVSPARPATPPGPPREQSWAWPGCYTAGPGNAERLVGGPDDDTIFAGGGGDSLEGNNGSDRLYGEDGNDDMNGGRGADTCQQGAGNGSVTSCP
jgi:Ca2+-binding RTX toxin-like protein